ncbi:MAG: helix-hairpin-helix domain-containing protein [Ruminococcus sp.]|nr:helix-hairpin-helix domain-containing protein [Ruminococcus sp.]
MPDDNEGYHSAYILALIGVLVLVVVFGNVLIGNSKKNDQRVIAKDSSYAVTKHSDDTSSVSDKSRSSSKSSSSGSSSSKEKKDSSSKRDSSLSKAETNAETKEATVVYSFPADINTADLGCLCAADGIGEELAGRIIDYRNSIGVIYNMDLLLEVDGIGEKKLDSLKEYFYVAEYQYMDIEPDDEKADERTEQKPAETRQETKTVTAVPPEEPKQMKKVRINYADAEEIADCLLLDIEQAEKIIELRELISYFSSPEELILNDTMNKEMILERIDYIVID